MVEITIIDSRSAAYPGRGPKLRPIPLTKHERRMRTAAQPKCSCGNCLSLDRSELGITKCPTCMPEPQADVACAGPCDNRISVPHYLVGFDHLCEECSKPSGAEVVDAYWRPMEDVPKDEPVLVLMPKDNSNRPRIHGAIFSSNGISIIGDCFGFDRPQPIGWQHPPAIPEGI